MTQTTVTLTGGAKVNLNINENRLDHRAAREALEIITDQDAVETQKRAVELALCWCARATEPEVALNILRDEWGYSDAKIVREALRDYAAEVDA